MFCDFGESWLNPYSQNVIVKDPRSFRIWIYESTAQFGFSILLWNLSWLFFKAHGVLLWMHHVAVLCDMPNSPVWEFMRQVTIHATSHCLRVFFRQNAHCRRISRGSAEPVKKLKYSALLAWNRHSRYRATIHAHARTQECEFHSGAFEESDRSSRYRATIRA